MTTRSRQAKLCLIKRNGAVKMPVNAPYDKYNVREVINQQFQNNNRAQHQHHPKEAVEVHHHQTRR